MKKLYKLLVAVLLGMGSFAQASTQTSVNDILIPVSEECLISLSLTGNVQQLHILGSGDIKYNDVGMVKQIGTLVVSYDNTSRIIKIGKALFKYDDSGRIKQIAKTVFKYDNSGRIEKVGTSIILYDESGRLIKIKKMPAPKK